jgi:hypothetical protein
MTTEEQRDIEESIQTQKEALARAYIEAQEGNYSFYNGIQILKNIGVIARGMTVKLAKKCIIEDESGNVIIEKAKTKILEKKEHNLHILG